MIPTWRRQVVPMSSTRSNAGLCLVAGALSLFAAVYCLQAGADELRAGPGLDYPVVGSVGAGEKLEPLGEDGEWVSVSAPLSVPAWVHSELIRGGEVAVPLAAVRAGPGIDQPVLAKLRQGAPVKILQTEGAWARIRTPGQCVVWIRKQSLDRGRVLAASPAPAGPRVRPERVRSPVPAPVPSVTALPQGGAVVLTGLVERVIFAWHSPGPYRLMSDDDRRPRVILTYLTGENAEMSRAQNKRVTVAGQLSQVPRALYPVMRVSRIRDSAPGGVAASP